jgi:DNA-binding PadR family transcriptional regulator
VGLNALYNALEGLKKNWLITERTGSHQARLFSLTAKGKKIVLHIKAIHEEMTKEQ